MAMTPEEIDKYFSYYCPLADQCHRWDNPNLVQKSCVFRSAVDNGREFGRLPDCPLDVKTVRAAIRKKPWLE